MDTPADCGRVRWPGVPRRRGYIDPGNWGTDLTAGSRYGYQLLWVLAASNLLAIFLQRLAAKLGLATGQDLARLIGQRLATWPRRAYATVAIITMAATEMAEFLGVVVALQLLLGLQLAAAAALGAVLVIGLSLARVTPRATARVQPWTPRGRHAEGITTLPSD